MTTSALLAALVMLPPVSGDIPVRFEYSAAEGVKSVSVAGTFNAWNKDANPMVMGADGRMWSATVNLSPGEFQYKFVVNGENWITDPKAVRNVDDGNGNTNSLLVVIPEEFRKLPGERGDGKLTVSAIRHSQEVPQLNYDRGQVTLSMTARANDVQKISVAVRRGGRVDLVPMTRVSGNAIFDQYRTTLRWDRKEALNYAFRLEDGTTVQFFGTKGLGNQDFQNFFQINPMTFKPFEVPSWVEGTVFYQIFPDRFDNGSKKNDPAEKTPWDGEPTYDNRFGGDVAGVQRRIAYLRRLGINGVYFNPVMLAPAYHRYDPVCFYTVDPEFGTNKEFVDLTHQMHDAGIRVVLDQIFDHVGVTFAPFADVLRFQEKSRFRDWFFIKSYPVEVRPNPPYVGWFGTEWMPKVNLANPGVYNYLMESVDFWMANAKLSGWRLDVANEVPDWFWRDFRKRVKGIDPNAWIVGEVWYDASQWLKGDQWDASMNYPFRDQCLRFIANGTIKPSQFVEGLMNVHNLYAPQVSRNQLNLLSSHDTPRFITEAGGDRKLAALGAVVQFTWPGAPSVYYGEEIGMEGGRDPQNRRGMRWDLVGPKNELLEIYTKLIHLRTQSRLLALGDPVKLTQFDEADVASYGRALDRDFAVVVLNRGSKPFTGVIQLPADQANTTFVDALSGRTFTADARGRLSVNLEPISALVGLNASPHHRTLVTDAENAAQKNLSIKEPLP